MTFVVCTGFDFADQSDDCRSDFVSNCAETGSDARFPLTRARPRPEARNIAASIE